MRWLFLTFGVFALACGPSVGEGDGDGGGDDSTSEGSIDDPDASGLTHTYVKLRFARGASEDASPYLGTTRVTVFLGYGECIGRFYSEHSELGSDEPEGALVFGPLSEGGEGWKDRLCASEEGFATCSVDSIGQWLLDVPVFGFQLTYSIEGELEGQQLRVGPLPTAEIAECDAGLLPTVSAMADVAIGKDGTDTTLWRTESFEPTEVVAGQGAPINVYASRF